MAQQLGTVLARAVYYANEYTARLYPVPGRLAAIVAERKVIFKKHSPPGIATLG